MTEPDIRELQCFLALVRSGSFSAAAHSLGVSQPAVSAQISKLEQVIGFPLFYRGPEGTSVTEQGQALVPLIEDIVREYTDLLRRAAYWRRAQTKQVKIWVDGSKAAQAARMRAGAVENHRDSEAWYDLQHDTGWTGALLNLEVDVVLAGSFLKAADVPGIRTRIIRAQRGITLAWNPTYHDFNRQSLSLVEAISSTAILPVSSMAMGFRDFLTHWCKSVYGQALDEAIECKSESDAVNACKLGLGVMLFPGDADERLGLGKEGLESVRAFEFTLPDAFIYGIRYRTDEQNPQILATVERLEKSMGKRD